MELCPSFEKLCIENRMSCSTLFKNSKNVSLEISVKNHILSFDAFDISRLYSNNLAFKKSSQLADVLK